MARSRGQSDLMTPPGELHENVGWEAGKVATIIVSKQTHSSCNESVKKSRQLSAPIEALLSLSETIRET